MRCFKCLTPTNFIPKSSTTKVNCIGRNTCRHRPGVCRHSRYPHVARRFLSSVLANFPACGSPYMPLLISRYTCSLCTFRRSWYSSIKSGGIRLMGMRMYSLQSIGVCKYIFLISMHAYFAPGVEMTLFHNSFVVIRSAVGVLRSPDTFNKLPPTVTRTRNGSCFCGL